MRPSSRIHAVISNGGKAPNIIPEFSEISIFVRSVTDKEMYNLKDKVLACAEGAASATGWFQYTFCYTTLINSTNSYLYTDCRFSYKYIYRYIKQFNKLQKY